jgi:integral membrane sensor domain MASE1
MAILAAMAALASWLSIVGTADHGSIATLWLANGLVLGTMLTYPDRSWPGLCIASGAGNLLGTMATGLSAEIALAFVACNMVEIVAGLVLLYRPGDPVEHFSERKSAVRICCGMAHSGRPAGCGMQPMPWGWRL